MRTYRVFGLNLRTGFRFTTRLTPSSGPLDLIFDCRHGPPPLGGPDLPEPVYSNPYPTEAGESVLSVHRLPSREVVRFSALADFHLEAERITCYLARGSAEYLAELRLLGPVLCLWLEMRSIRALHASAVVVDGGAVGFLSGRRSGKSALAAIFLRGSCSLLTDDILAVEHTRSCWLARPGYPQLRLWPEVAHHFLGDQPLKRVYPGHEKRRVPVGRGGLGQFCDAARALKCLYRPRREVEADGRNGTIQIEALPKRDALIELIRHSFAARLVEAMGLRNRRLELLAQLAETVPVRRLVYPEGLEHLEAVRQRVSDDLAGW